MSVLIKGMEMSKNCGECFACKAELSQEKKVIYVCCFTREEYVSDENRVETDCPLIPIPPHGRLVDADALTSKLWEQRRNYQLLDNTQTADKIMHGLYRAEQIIGDMPTIMEAEESDE